ncbi:MAG: Sec-independent protein translocase subunit TatA/TatB [Pseudobdellovibrionaceae bacterium]
MNLGWTEILLIGGIALLVFGPSRLPGLGKSLGEAIRGFKKGISEDEAEAQKDLASTTKPNPQISEAATDSPAAASHSEIKDKTQQS